MWEYQAERYCCTIYLQYMGSSLILLQAISLSCYAQQVQF